MTLPEMKPYKTLMREARTEYVVNKSRFIGAAAPVHSSQEALAFLEEERRKYKDATHHCYAYIIGQNAGIMRYSDDGEPGGTAGMPMMDVIRHSGAVDCIVVVTRYFGGILLGTGGLVRAYSHSCALALGEARVCEMHPSEKAFCEVPYSLWDRVQYTLKNLPVQVEDIRFDTRVTFELLNRTADGEKVHKELNRASDGKIAMLLEGEFYSPWQSAFSEE